MTTFQIQGVAGLVRSLDELGTRKVRQIVRPAIRAGTHHLGTTRMSADPKQGVVDGNCRVHGVSNLYIAGSSVFATSGTSNPTWTLVALAVRLADEIKRRLRGRVPG